MDGLLQIGPGDIRRQSRRFRVLNREKTCGVKPVQPPDQSHLEGAERAFAVVKQDVFCAILSFSSVFFA